MSKGVKDRVQTLVQAAEARVLSKLEWPELVDILSGMSQTDDGRERCLALSPSLDRPAIEERWSLVEPLRVVATQGYRAPIGAVPRLGGVFRAAKVGQVLDGESLRGVADL